MLMENKKIGIFLFKLALAFIFLWFLVHTSQFDFKLLFTLLMQPLLCLPIMCILCVNFFNAWRWHRLLSALKIHFPYLATLLLTYINIAFNNVLPGSVGGDIFRLYCFIKKMPAHKQAAILSTLFDRIIGLMAIFCIITGIAIYYYAVFSQNHNLYYIFMSSLVLCMSSIGFFIALIVLPQEVKLTQWLAKHCKHHKIMQHFISLLVTISRFRHAKLILLECMLASIFSQILLSLSILFITHLMGLPAISFFAIAIALGIAQIINLLPLTPGGIGLGEAAFANVILLIYPSTTAAYATVFFAFRAFLALAYLPGIFIGIFGFDAEQQPKLLLAEETI